MKLGEGIYKSSLATDDWRPDPEVGGEMHTLLSEDQIEAGLSRFATAQSDPIEWTLPKRETVLILEGEARIEIAGGPTLELRAGDIASMPKGARTTWHLTTPFREFWVLA